VAFGRRGCAPVLRVVYSAGMHLEQWHVGSVSSMVSICIEYVQDKILNDELRKLHSLFSTCNGPCSLNNTTSDLLGSGVVHIRTHCL
jgi:hypothetical protein